MEGEYAENGSSTPAPATLTNDKLVYTCNLSIETTEYKDTVDKIRASITKYGAIVGAGMILLSAAFGPRRMERIITFRTFRIACASALCFYSVSKLYSFFCGANGLHTIFSPGTPGRILSAGLILPLNIAVGVVVSFTMYGLYSLFERGRIG